MKKKMTVTVTSVKQGEIKGQWVAEGKAKGYRVKFDILEELFSVKEGDKLVFEIRDSKPQNLENYVFCGHGYIVRDLKREHKEAPNYTVFSVWGVIFRFEPRLEELEPGKKYYLCITRG